MDKSQRKQTKTFTRNQAPGPQHYMSEDRQKAEETIAMTFTIQITHKEQSYRALHRDVRVIRQRPSSPIKASTRHLTIQP